MSEETLTTLLTENLAVTVHFDYQPNEAQTNTYPGCPAVVELNAVCVGDIDIMSVLSKHVLAELIEACMASTGTVL